MQVVDRLASSGYSYLSPAVDRACTVVPLLGGVKHRIEPYAPLVIERADACIDKMYFAAEERAVALREIAAPIISRATDMKSQACDTAHAVIYENQLAVRARNTSLAFLDTLDMLIDRYLPDESSTTDGREQKASEAVIPRALRLSIRIPVRAVHITVVKMQNGRETVSLSIRWAIKLTSDQKAKLKGLIMSRSRAIVDRASTSTLAVSLQHGKQGASAKTQAALQRLADGKRAASVRCYVVCERLRIIEVTCYARDSVDAVQQAARHRSSALVMLATRGVFGVAKRIAGAERASGLFAKIGERLPIVKSAITIERSCASTAECDDGSSTGTPDSNSPKLAAVEAEDDVDSMQKISLQDASPKLDNES